MFGRHGVPKSRVEVLSAAPMFEGLPRKVLTRIDSHCDEIRVEPGQTLTQEGVASRERPSSPRASCSGDRGRPR